MRVLLVTNNSNHHKYWAYELFSKFEVVGVCQPNSKPNRKILLRNLKKSNLVFVFLKLLSSLHHKFSKNSFTQKLNKYQGIVFNEAKSNFDKIPNEIVYTVDSINSQQSIKRAKELNPDVVCFLGGDIVKKEFLEIANIGNLNYHSGISPFYNGSGTTFSAVADSRPNFCGGTLMSMNERIDGGDILAHYLTPVNHNDEAPLLFLKGIKGSVKIYSQILEYIKRNKVLPSGFKQMRSVKYCISSDWTIYQDIKLREFEKSGKMKRYKREEKIISYYGNTRNENDKFPLYFEALNDILKKNEKE